ncbi:MAG: hypothetical protein ABJA98_25805 [Acidobacteriota bacterium]
MAVEESQHLQLAAGFYANGLKPMLDIGVGECSSTIIVNPIFLPPAKRTKKWRPESLESA